MADPLPPEIAQQIEQLEKELRQAHQEGRESDAIELAWQIVRLREQHQGLDWWETIDARVRAQFAESLAGMAADQRTTVASALAQFQKGARLLEQRQLTAAEECLRDSIDSYQSTLGENHSHLASAIVELGSVRYAQGKLSDAEQLARDAVAIRKESLGDAHPQTAVAMNNLALYLTDQHRLPEAESVHRKALQIKRTAYGDRHRSTVQSVHNLACNLHTQGRYAEAEPLFQQAVRLRTELLGQRHPDTATALNNLARNRKACGRHAEAEQIYRQAWSMRRDELGDEHPDTLNSASTLAACLHAQGRSAEAEDLLRMVYKVRRSSLGPTHRDSIEATNNLASTLKAQKKFAEAETLFRQSIAACRKSLGNAHANTALALHNLGGVLNAQSQMEEAEDSFRQGLAICRQVLGDQHASTALTAASLAACLQAQDRLEESEAAWRQAVQYYEHARRRVSFAGLERSAFAAQRSPYPGLATVLARLDKAVDAWECLESGFARGLLDDLAIRNTRRLDDGDLTRERELAIQMQTAQTRFDRLARSAGSEADKKLTEARRAAEHALEEVNQFRSAMNSKYGAASGEISELSTVQATLAPETALVAWIDIEGRGTSARGEHWVCVVRSTGDPRWIDIGNRIGMDDAALRVQLLSCLQQRNGGWHKSAEALCQSRIQPLLEILAAAGKLPAVEHLIVLPSPALAGIPIGILLSTASDVTQLTVSSVPSGTLLVHLATKGSDGNRQAVLSGNSRLLAVGDPAFVAASQLPGTQMEVESIAGMFDSPTVLTGTDASAKTFEQLASEDRLRKFDVIHLATHGTIDPVYPLRSSLILAASEPENLSPTVAQTDSRLPAEEILQTWTLNSNLVTLSACQSGLGEDNRGEGYLGLSQALFLAGTRSLLLSLWKVDDSATALLMQRFYENLVGFRANATPMTAAAALYEAQQWLRQSTRAELRDAASNTTRDLGPAPEGETGEYRHPYYWAGFIVLGRSGGCQR